MTLNKRQQPWTKHNDWTEYDQEQKTMAMNRKKQRGQQRVYTPEKDKESNMLSFAPITATL